MTVINLKSASRKQSPKQAVERELLSAELGMNLIERVAVIKGQAASRITWHEHRVYEVLFILEGATSYEFSDHHTVDLPGGHFLLIKPGTKHRGVHDVRSPARLCGIMIDPQQMKDHANSFFTKEELTWISQRFSQGSLQASKMNAELKRLVNNLAQLLSNDNFSSQDKTAGLRLTLYGIILELAKIIPHAKPVLLGSSIQLVINFMKDHLHEQLQVEDFTKLIKCSRARLFQIFKDSTGMAPNDYLQRLRIQAAQDSLGSTNLSITDISLKCGFSTSQYFSNVFRKYTGYTPSEYRTRTQRLHKSSKT